VCLSAPKYTKLSKLPLIQVIYPDNEEKPNQIKPKVHTECKPKTGNCYTTSECYLQYGEKDFPLCIRPDGVQGVCCMIQDNKPPTDGSI